MKKIIKDDEDKTKLIEKGITSIVLGFLVFIFSIFIVVVSAALLNIMLKEDPIPNTTHIQLTQTQAISYFCDSTDDETIVNFEYNDGIDKIATYTFKGDSNDIPITYNTSYIITIDNSTQTVVKIQSAVDNTIIIDDRQNK